jgi:hypothetical protein
MFLLTFSIVYTIKRDDGMDLIRNMLWYTCLIKHAKTLLRTKDCCTSSELEQINLEGYKLGAAYCKKSLLKGRVCIFVHKKIQLLKCGSK